jgi:cytochrome c553
MNPRRTGRWALGGTTVALGLLALGTGPTGVSAQPPAESKPAPVRVAEARERAKLLHQVYSAALDAIHHRYFRSDRATLPARALEDVFKDVEKETNIQAKWIAVNTPAMSIHHEPDSEFEKAAARALAAGKTEYEQVADGMYQRAGVIPLKAGCVGCHTNNGFATQSKTPRFAGLVIRVPVSGK